MENRIEYGNRKRRVPVIDYLIGLRSLIYLVQTRNFIITNIGVQRKKIFIGMRQNTNRIVWMKFKIYNNYNNNYNEKKKEEKIVEIIL